MSIANLRTWLLAVLVFACAGAGTPDIEQLRKQADAVLAKDAVQARPEVAVAFQAADALANAGRLTEADHYYLGALRVQPHDFEHHLRYAQVLGKEGKTADAETQIQIILNGAEDPAIIAKAQKLAGTPAAAVTPFDPAAVHAVTIILVPLGDVHTLLIQQEQKELHEDLGIDVQVHSLPVQMPKSAGSPTHTSAEALRNQWQKAREGDPAKFAKLLSAAGMTSDDLKDDAKVIQFTIKTLRDSGQEEGARQVEQMAARSQEQWSAEAILNALGPAIPRTTNPKVRFIGITSRDIFMQGTNFVFASYAVAARSFRIADSPPISTASFPAAFACCGVSTLNAWPLPATSIMCRAAPTPCVRAATRKASKSRTQNPTCSATLAARASRPRSAPWTPTRARAQ